ncbi:hypothetical protein [Burkholderia cenocepacia]|uniref:hypothetical protein n=1 Tax=Burkholderia cenocepacia TaxID=95486 RepID=UPI0002ACC5B1|nr:hypothetical protein [Burkholderia cenocepacia]EPZ86293.1 hypothetical protein BURCENK562V_C6205 [Burkholderia cenocepacia K56-2Valvano]ERI30530.1 hypothetical protein BURCENBC7_AP7782 [Burkholderia cenocepacia BC7]ONR60180.1 hypothetical protein A8E17_14030 [Burkholderia cenocepacia]ONR61317.1 hypothetical protein A8E23_30530 [Burkholderia cenocepacia]ONR72311.1 hypothetical protein A8E22_30200 [Burkholderia cenocepacia]
MARSGRQSPGRRLRRLIGITRPGGSAGVSAVSRHSAGGAMRQGDSMVGTPLAAGGVRNVVALSALHAQVTYNIGFAPGHSAVAGAD